MFITIFLALSEFYMLTVLIPLCTRNVAFKEGWPLTQDRNQYFNA